MSPVLLAHSRARTLATALGASDDDLLTAIVQDGLNAQDALWLTKQSLAAYTRYRLRRAGLWEFLDTTTAETLSRGYALSAVHETVQHRAALLEALDALRHAGVEFVVLKGLALAYTVYPAPQLRTKSDADVWVPRDSILAAIEALRRVGYAPRVEGGMADTRLTAPETEILLTQPHTTTTKIELQFPPMRGLWARACARIDHDAIWNRAETVQMEGQPIRVLSPADTLVHVAFHQAINHQFTYPCWLRSLFDVHFLVLQGHIAWDTVVESAMEWQLQTVTWTVLSLVRNILGTPIPSQALDALTPSVWQRTLLARLPIEASILEARPADYRVLRYLVQAAMVDRPVDGLGMLRQALFPDTGWLRERYALPTTTHPLQLQLYHWRRLATARRA